MHVERVQEGFVKDARIGCQDGDAAGLDEAAESRDVDLGERLTRSEDEQDADLRDVRGEGVALQRERRRAHRLEVRAKRGRPARTRVVDGRRPASSARAVSGDGTRD